MAYEQPFAVSAHRGNTGQVHCQVRRTFLQYGGIPRICAACRSLASRCGPIRPHSHLVFPFEGTAVEIPLVYFTPVEIRGNLQVLVGCGHVSSIESENPFLPYVEMAIRMFGFTRRRRQFFGGSGGTCSRRYSRLCFTVGMSVCPTVCGLERGGVSSLVLRRSRNSVSSLIGSISNCWFVSHFPHLQLDSVCLAQSQKKVTKNSIIAYCSLVFV